MRPSAALRRSIRSGDLDSLAPYALAFLYGLGGLLLAVSCLVPGKAETGFALVAAGGALLLAAGLVVLASRIGPRSLSGLIALSSLIVAVHLLVSGRPASPDAVVYLWVALSGGFFLSRRALVGQVAFVGLTYAAALFALPDRARAASEVGPQYLIMVVGAVAVAAVWVASLRGLVDWLFAEQARMARTDSLTGLPNRAHLRRAGEDAIARYERSGSDVAVLMIDLDGFKLVNDELGHAAGDQLLSQVATRLRAVTRDGDHVARLGGDEFAILLETPAALLSVEAAAERVLTALRAPFHLRADNAHIGASVGVALAQRDASIETLLRDADLAMYVAKRAGGGWSRFSEGMEPRIRPRKTAVVTPIVPLAPL